MDIEADDNGDVNMSFLGSLEPHVDDFVSDMLLQQIGSSGRGHRREAASACRRMVSEMYSPPRVTKELARSRNKHLVPGFALDLTVTDPADGMPWDFTLSEKRERARALVRSQKPFLLIGSPECRAFCTWQALNEARSGNSALMRLKREEATLHLPSCTWNRSRAIATFSTSIREAQPHGRYRAYSASRTFPASTWPTVINANTAPR